MTSSKEELLQNLIAFCRKYTVKMSLHCVSARDGFNASEMETRLSKMKNINDALMFWMMYFELLKDGQTVDADIYCQQLSRVDLALRRQGVNTSRIKFLQDNASSHTAKVSQKKIEELGWKLLPHPPYSPDLAPSDYHLFRSMQNALLDKRFKNREEI
ncbi:hypothetical protein Q1695_008200 [Nippostrongylus brasiliensis]|nr:hypothetical protein Q1695_008200 [Nippostrongylus brasiliensis]